MFSFKINTLTPARKRENGAGSGISPPQQHSEEKGEASAWPLLPPAPTNDCTMLQDPPWPPWSPQVLGGAGGEVMLFVP